ncbi:MAG: nuclear transport factor 2 family protein [Verrucomicrobiae bacterium]|nr:nuclear transport factor 2 family protein [Verrucomicrobiae bacterium]
MKSKILIHTALTACALTFLTGVSQADHHEPEMLKGKIQQFYANMAQGDFDAAFDFVSTGTSGYLPNGLLVSIPNDAVKAMVIQGAKADRAAGEISQLYPKHIDVKMLGTDHAVATYYVEGKATEGDETKHVLNRASLVIGKDGDAWKIVHWHVSKLEREDDGE